MEKQMNEEGPSDGHSSAQWCVDLTTLVTVPAIQRILQTTRRPCCRKETARCRKCSFPLKFANNIHYKY